MLKAVQYIGEHKKYLAKFENLSEIYGRDTYLNFEYFVNSSKKVGQNAKKCPNKELETTF